MSGDTKRYVTAMAAVKIDEAEQIATLPEVGCIAIVVTTTGDIEHIRANALSTCVSHFPCEGGWAGHTCDVFEVPPELPTPRSHGF